VPKLVVQGALLQCSQGMAPASFAVAVPHATEAGDIAAGNIDDYTPNANVPTFGMCQSPANPQVAAATAAALGVLTPQPCIPMLVAPWSPGSNSVTIRDRPALNDSCTCNCQWAGQVSVTNAGQTQVEVD
jgi:hypothetical protein